MKNLEIFPSINFLRYYNMERKMNQRTYLLNKYEREYDEFASKKSRFMKYMNAQRHVLENNRACERERIRVKNGGDPYDGDFSLIVKKIPSQPSGIDDFKYMKHPNDMRFDDICKYYGEERFVKSWMLNISPAWKGVTITKEMLEFFQVVLRNFYENCNRFTDMQYVLENGHGSDHLHAHAVFVLNVRKPGFWGKQCAFRKSKILTEFRNCWNREAKLNMPSAVDLCKSYHALNTCLLTTPLMYQDKIDYLCEELKPESHKNDPHPMCPVRGGVRGYEKGG